MSKRMLTLLLLLVVSMIACSSDKEDSNSGNSGPTVIDYTRWQLADVQSLGDLVDRRNLESAVLSPDGASLAWVKLPEPELCVYSLQAASSLLSITDSTPGPNGEADATSEPEVPATPLTCTPPPPEFEGIPRRVAWSGDSQHLFFTEDGLIRRDESDIWDYTPASQTFINLTEDGLVGNLMRWQEGDPPMQFDLMPTWNAATNMLYFIRQVFQNQRNLATLGLYRLDTEGPVLVRDFTTDLPFTYWVLANPTFSPDGKRLAVLAPAALDETGPGGLWVLTLEGGKLEHLATSDTLRGEGASEWQTDELHNLNAVSVAWAGNQGLVVFLSNNGSYIGTDNIGTLAVYVDAASGEVTRLTDISRFTSSSTMNTADADGHLGRYYLPRRGMISPDGGTFFYVHRDPPLYVHDDVPEDHIINISALALPPDGKPPVLVSRRIGADDEWYRSDPPDYYRHLLQILQPDGWVLVGANLLHFVAE